MLSGIAALVYQVVWQRLLFTILGKHRISNANRFDFMFGLGMGAFAGGWLSENLQNCQSFFYGLK